MINLKGAMHWNNRKEAIPEGAKIQLPLKIEIYSLIGQENCLL